jgi:hypothetical protein
VRVLPQGRACDGWMAWQGGLRSPPRGMILLPPAHPGACNPRSSTSGSMRPAFPVTALSWSLPVTSPWTNPCAHGFWAGASLPVPVLPGVASRFFGIRAPPHPLLPPRDDPRSFQLVRLLLLGGLSFRRPDPMGGIQLREHARRQESWAGWDSLPDLRLTLHRQGRSLRLSSLRKQE